MVGGVGDGGVCGRWSTGVDMGLFSLRPGRMGCSISGSVRGSVVILESSLRDVDRGIGLGDISVGGAAASQNHCGGIASGISGEGSVNSFLYNGLEMSWGDTSPSLRRSTSPFATIGVFGCFRVDLKRLRDISYVSANVSGRDACGV